jgi:hypothetical protein
VKPVRILVSLALVVVLAVAAEGQDKAEKKGKKPAGTQGVVEGVDAKNKTITFRTGNKKENTLQSTTVSVTDTTKITVRDESTPKGRDGKIEDLAAGKRVVINVEEKDGKKVATTVTVMDARKKKEDK